MEDTHEKAFLGRRIRALRDMKGWTQQQLGDRADVNYKFVGEIERGQQNPSFNTLFKIANALNVEIMELLLIELKTLLFRGRTIEKFPL